MDYSNSRAFEVHPAPGPPGEPPQPRKPTEGPEGCDVVDWLTVRWQGVDWLRCDGKGLLGVRCDGKGSAPSFPVDTTLLWRAVAGVALGPRERNRSRDHLGVNQGRLQVGTRERRFESKS